MDPKRFDGWLQALDGSALVVRSADAGALRLFSSAFLSSQWYGLTSLHTEQ